MNLNNIEIKLYKIETASDDRGYLRFCNEFNFSKYVRFYDVINYKNNFIRAWHGHKYESKAVTVREGSAMICIIQIDDWIKPSKELKINKFFISDKDPKILEIPAGFVNGFMTLEPNTKLTYYSDKSLNQSIDDDYRFEFNFWSPWEIIYR